MNNVAGGNLTDRLSVNVCDTRITHRLPGPFAAEHYEYSSVVLNGHGINWTQFPDHPGGVLFPNADMANEAARKLNEAPTCG